MAKLVFPAPWRIRASRSGCGRGVAPPGSARLGLALGAALALGPASAHGARADAGPLLTPLQGFSALDDAGDNADGAQPYAALVAPGDGFLYGTASAGGPNGQGTVFRVRPDGTGFGVIHAFAPVPDGAAPQAALLAPGDGFLYGTTVTAGPGGEGTVFRLHADGTGFAVIHGFTAENDSGDNADGALPCAALVALGDGFLYGTASAGGADGQGTVYRLSPDGTVFQDLHDFGTLDGAGLNSDGAFPCAALLAGGDGSLYGMAPAGGAGGAGTAFRCSRDGTSFTTLYPFSTPDPDTGVNVDGALPCAALVAPGDGFFYGTAGGGGMSDAGTVFRLSTDGTPAGTRFQTIHSFSAPDSGTGVNADGAAPSASLTPGSDGLLYGTADAGGANGCGTVFRLLAGGVAFQPWYSFGALGADADGAGPASELLALGDGSLCGTAPAGGAGGSGTVFRLSAPPSPPVTHLLWSNTDHRAMFWNVGGDGTPTVAGGYGPYTDGSDPKALWTATALATGPDGVSHILWNNTDHRVMLWNVLDDGSFTVIGGYGPYTDGGNAANLWSAVGLSVGPDNVMHLLWNNTDHRAMFWNVTQSGAPTVLSGYGPYTDNAPQNVWDVTGVSTGPDNVSHLLWSNSDKRAMFWDVSDTDGSFQVKAGYGPYTDSGASNLWGALGVSTGPDNVSHLLWNNTDLRAMFWNVSSGDGSFSVLNGYGPYTDNAPQNKWSVTGLATGPDNVSHLLWNNTDNRVMLWTLSATGGVASVSGYGPYTDGAPQNRWSAVSVSAGP